MEYGKVSEQALKDASEKAGKSIDNIRLAIQYYLSSVAKECKDYKSANMFDGLSDCIEHRDNSDYYMADFTKDSLCK